MRQIVLFGAGKSSVALIEYLLVNAVPENWHLTVADANKEAILEKIGNSGDAEAVALDVTNNTERSSLVQKADIVISLLPPSLHILVANDCLFYKKNLLTASYVDDQVSSLQEKITEAGVLFLYEMGLDPGIDHMSAKRLIDEIHEKGGEITSFLSHCGGLVAPESDDNPWHYKISWNPKNVVLAGKAGAAYRQEGAIVELGYRELFAEQRYVQLPGLPPLCWYPNRDSLRYLTTYGLSHSANFIRTTLRHPDFIFGWKNLLELNLTDETKHYQTDGKSLQQFFKEHLEKQEFGEWIQKKMHEEFDSTKTLLTELVNLVKKEEEAVKQGLEPVDEFLLVNDQGDLQEVDIDQLKVSAAATLAHKMHHANLTLKQLFYLGMDDDTTLIDRGTCSAADVLQFVLEKKLMLQPADKDMVVMLHELEYVVNGARNKTTSTLVQKGESAVHTAMAKTVGLPLGIAAKLVLNGTINSKGLQVPVTKEIYGPVLTELETAGISFTDKTTRL